MNTKRIAALLHYDWMLHHHTIKLTGIVIGIIYLCLALLYFTFKYELNIEGGGEALPAVISLFCYTYFNYATLAAMLVVTTILTEKFCYPRTATAYLTLPGTSFEKFIVMLAEYGIAWVAMQIFFIVMFYITMGVCAINAPELDWMQNVLIYFNPQELSTTMDYFVTNILHSDGSAEALDEMAMQSGAAGMFGQAMINLITAAYWMNPICNIAVLAYYLILNMCFKSNVQIKAIACMFLTYFVFIVIMMISIFGVIGVSLAAADEAEVVMTHMCSIFNCITIFLYMTPLFAAYLLYVFYRQIKRKQAK